MTRLQYNVAMTIGALSLLLALFIIIFAQINRSKGRLVMERQVMINRGNMSEQIGRNLLMDMGQVALRNPKMKELLSRNGYTVNQNSNPEGGR
jgi:hypothetical protein